MKKQFPFPKILLLVIFFFWGNQPLLAQTDPNTNGITSDTFRIQNKYPFKVWKGEQRIKKINSLEPVVLSVNDWKINKDWSSGKTLYYVGLSVEALGALLAGRALLQTIRGEGSNSIIGPVVMLGGLSISVAGVSKQKKVLRRYNAIAAGRIMPMDKAPVPPAAENPKAKIKTAEATTTDSDEEIKPEMRTEETTDLKPKKINVPPAKISSFFREDSLGNSLKATSNDIGFGLKAAGLRGMFWESDFDSIAIQIRKVSSPDIIIRGDLTIIAQKEKTGFKSNDFSGGYSYEETSTGFFALGISPGVEKHFPGTRRLDPYVGVALPIAFTGKVRLKEKDDDVDSDGGYTKRQTTQTTPGAFGLGLDGLVGINFYLAKRLSIGIEYSLGFTYLRSKGDVKFKTVLKSKVNDNSPETTTTNETEGDEINVSGFYFGNKGVAGLNLIYYLGR